MWGAALERGIVGAASEGSVAAAVFRNGGLTLLNRGGVGSGRGGASSPALTLRRHVLE